jgi:hypothetical protein
VVAGEEDRTRLPRETIAYAMLLALAERVGDQTQKRALVRAWNPHKDLADKLTDRREFDVKTSITLENLALAEIARRFLRLRQPTDELGDYLQLVGYPHASAATSHPSGIRQAVQVDFYVNPDFDGAEARFKIRVGAATDSVRSIRLPLDDYLRAVVPSDDADQLQSFLIGETRGIRLEPQLRSLTFEPPLERGHETEVRLGPRAITLFRMMEQAVGVVMMPGWDSLTIAVYVSALGSWPKTFYACVEDEEARNWCARGISVHEDWFTRKAVATATVPDFPLPFGYTFQGQPAGTKCVLGWVHAEASGSAARLTD